MLGRFCMRVVMEEKTLLDLIEEAIAPHEKSGIEAANEDMDKLCEHILFGLEKGMPGVMLSPAGYVRLPSLARRYYLREVQSWLPDYIPLVKFNAHSTDRSDTVAITWS